MKNVVRWTWALALALLCGVSSRAAAADDPWAGGSNWLTVRAGFAKSTADLNGNGGGGYGIAYTRMLHSRKIWRWSTPKDFSIGASVHHEMLSNFGSAHEITVPATVEIARHFDWHSPFRPYLGLGAGPVFRKLYRTGADLRVTDFGYYVSFGGNIPVSRMRVIGADVRWLRVDAANDPANPVFGTGSGKYRVLPDGSVEITTKKATQWSVKVGYSFAY